jgi:hypothetical protein
MFSNITKLLRSLFSVESGPHRGANTAIGSGTSESPIEAYKDFVCDRIQRFPEGDGHQEIEWSSEQLELARREWACFLIFVIHNTLRHADVPKGSSSWKLKDEIEIECTTGKMPEFFAVGRALDSTFRPPLVKFPSAKGRSTASLMIVPGVGIIRNRVNLYSKFSKGEISESPMGDAVEVFLLIGQYVVNDGNLENSHLISPDLERENLHEIVVESKAANPNVENLFRKHADAFRKVNGRLIRKII